MLYDFDYIEGGYIRTSLVSLLIQYRLILILHYSTFKIMLCSFESYIKIKFSIYKDSVDNCE